MLLVLLLFPTDPPSCARERTNSSSDGLKLHRMSNSPVGFLKATVAVLVTAAIILFNKNVTVRLWNEINGLTSGRVSKCPLSLSVKYILLRTYTKPRPLRL